MSSLQHGFALVPQAFSAMECDSILDRLTELNVAGTRCLLAHDWCQSLSRKIKARLQAAFPEIDYLDADQCTYFNKSPEQNWFVGYHQDRSIPVAASMVAESFPGWSRKEEMTFVHGPDETLAQMIAVRLHLDDCTSENGPLRVIPDTHRT